MQHKWLRAKICWCEDVSGFLEVRGEPGQGTRCYTFMKRDVVPHDSPPKLVEGEEVTFECKADGVPKPKIKWIHNGQPIELAEPNSNRIVTPERITIKNLRKSDTGNYGCNATNSIGYQYEDVYVNVLGKSSK